MNDEQEWLESEIKVAKLTLMQLRARPPSPDRDWRIRHFQDEIGRLEAMRPMAQGTISRAWDILWDMLKHMWSK